MKVVHFVYSGPHLFPPTRVDPEGTLFRVFPSTPSSLLFCGPLKAPPTANFFFLGWAPFPQLYLADFSLGFFSIRKGSPPSEMSLFGPCSPARILRSRFVHHLKIADRPRSPVLLPYLDLASFQAAFLHGVNCPIFLRCLFWSLFPAIGPPEDPPRRRTR